MVQATAPDEVRNSTLLVVTYATAALFCSMALLQLVNFQGFVADIGQYSHLGLTSRLIVALLIVVLEVFSLPFLFRLWLSQLARFASAIFVVVLPLVWGVLLMPAFLQQAAITNTGLLGDFVHLPIGGMAIALELLLLAGSLASFLILGGLKVTRLR